MRDFASWGSAGTEAEKRTPTLGESEAGEHDAKRTTSAFETPAKENSDDQSGQTVIRDPTMPQFRPNSLVECEKLDSTPSSTSASSDESSLTALTSLAGPTDTLTGEEPEDSMEENDKNRHTRRIPELLSSWNRLDLAEKEAKERGGWGKLSYEEFERIFIQESQRGEQQRLDYLGSWIDFCIP